MWGAGAGWERVGGKRERALLVEAPGAGDRPFKTAFRDLGGFGGSRRGRRCRRCSLPATGGGQPEGGKGHEKMA